MKTSQKLTLLLLVLATINACTPKMSFVTSPVVPAASGNVTIKKDKNKNYTIKLDVRNLAEAKNLTPAKNTYLVWMKQSDNSVKKLGQLTPSGKSLSASLNATAIDKPETVFITAEDNVEIVYPAGDTILTTRR